MAVLNNWRVIQIGENRFLAALEIFGHNYIHSGPIITSIIVDGDLCEGGVVRTKSGSIYTLKSPLPENENCEFARYLLVERASRYFNSQGKTLRLEDLEALERIIDTIISKKCVDESNSNKF